MTHVLERCPVCDADLLPFTEEAAREHLLVHAAQAGYALDLMRWK